MNPRSQRSKANHPGERMRDQTVRARVSNFLFGDKRFYRDIWLLFITAAVMFALSTFKDNSDQQQIGRANSVTANCAFYQAIVTGGRETLMDVGSNGRRYARKYTTDISNRVERDTGVQDIVNPVTGDLDCNKYRAIARVSPVK